jgi:general secretion pathway protein G
MSPRSIHSRKTSRTLRGFTLIELLLVLVILAVLAAVVIPNVAGYGEKAKRQGTIADIASFKAALAAFEVDNSRFPTTEEGLTALVVAPSDLASTWKAGGYLPSVPNDKYGNAYIYRYPGTINAQGFDIVSVGKDGQEGTDDDINQFTEK